MELVTLVDAYAKGRADALADVRRRVVAIFGPRCRRDLTDMCAVHAEPMFTDTCVDWRREYDLVLAAITEAER